MIVEAEEVLSKNRVVAEDLVHNLIHDVEQDYVERSVESDENEDRQEQTGSTGEEAVLTNQRAVESAAEIIAEHRRLWAKVNKKLVAGLCKRNLDKGLEQLKVAKLAGDILSVIVKGQRQAWGIEAIEKEFHSDDTQEIIEEMASLTAPSRADTALD